VFGVADGAEGDIEVRSPHAEAIVKQVQQALIGRGYRAGAVDGQLSADTVAAIRTYETDQGLVPKGRISAEVLERLQTGISAGGKHPVEGQ
jgi:peptidoglycan hydrolase-like protein with peptidoglycan-binding domain